MQLFYAPLSAAVFLATTLAAPIPIRRACDEGIGGSTVITPEQLLQISSSMAACDPSSATASECRTAEQASPFVNEGFSTYNITTKGEKAAILSLMLFESGNFKFDINHFPGEPGQGTRNLMKFPGVYQYAVDTPETSAQALALVPDLNDPNNSNSTKNEVRALVLPDKLSFASGMWFYKASGPEKTGCTGDQAIVDGLQGETVEGWTAYIERCISTTVTPDRKEVWEKTLAAL
ncbi:hypothetical protein HGRIS_003008 [Hohenbuehelia grisea]|uniref:Uncharacterized protein n=1 Tax=Hohenbuehelia grisea TaxID=104357 RepID=A0ABR3JNM9_9AGAR